MAQLTYPESMDALDVNDVPKSLNVIQNYIGYICERTDFAMRNMTKTVTAAGISSVEMYILLQAMSNQLSALQSTVNGIGGDVTALKNTVGSGNTGLVGAVSALQTTVGDANSGLVKSVDDLGTAVGSLQTAVGDANSGLVKAVADINAEIGDEDTPGTILYRLKQLET